MSVDLLTRMRKLRDETVWPHDEAYGEWTAHIVEVESGLSKLYEADLTLAGKVKECAALESKLSSVEKHESELIAEVSDALDRLHTAESRLEACEKERDFYHKAAHENERERDAALLRLSAVSNLIGQQDIAQTYTMAELIEKVSAILVEKCSRVDGCKLPSGHGGLCRTGSYSVVESLPTWCPKCKAVMAHVPHQCGVVERHEHIYTEGRCKCGALDPDLRP